MKKLLIVGCMLAGTMVMAQPPEYPPAPPSRTVVKAEYFFDVDPGIGNATVIALTPAADITNLSVNLPLSGSALNNGIHRLYIRTQDDLGKWSLTNSFLFDNFLVPAYPSAPGAAGNLVEVEYFIDTDPGLGLGKKISVPASGNIGSANVLIDISGVPAGVHRLYVRTKDASGKWSFTNYAVFDNALQTPYPPAPVPVQALTEAEYFFDTDPGLGNGTAINIPASTDVPDFSLSVPIGSLAQGRHTIYLRSRQNPWSMTAYAEFMLGSTLPVQWLYVKAEEKAGDAIVSWATAAEVNAEKFVVEYSRDGVRFTNAGEVSANNQANGSSYSYRHRKPGNGTIYYRIKQIDNDGKFTWSKVMMLLFRDGMTKPVLFPNPVTTTLYIALPAGFKAQTAALFDMSGRQVRTVKLSASEQVLNIPVQDLTAGTYLLQLQNEKEIRMLPFVKN